MQLERRHIPPIPGVLGPQQYQQQLAICSRAGSLSISSLHESSQLFVNLEAKAIFSGKQSFPSYSCVPNIPSTSNFGFWGNSLLKLCGSSTSPAETSYFFHNSTCVDDLSSCTQLSTKMLLSGEKFGSWYNHAFGIIMVVRDVPDQLISRSSYAGAPSEANILKYLNFLPLDGSASVGHAFETILKWHHSSFASM